MRLGLPREYFVAGMEPGVEARIREAVAALEAAGADRRGRQPAAHRSTAWRPTTSSRRPRRRRTWRATTASGTGPGSATDGDVLADYLATRGRGFGAEVKRRIMLGTYALSAGYYDAYYLKAQKVRTLIKGDFDALWAQGFDALVAPTSPTVAFRVRRADGRPRLDVPLGRVHAAGEHGRPARHLDPVRAVGGPAGRPAAHRRAVVRGATCSRLARGYEAITADADWRRLEPTDLAASAATDRRGPRPLASSSRRGPETGPVEPGRLGAGARRRGGADHALCGRSESPDASSG